MRIHPLLIALCCTACVSAPPIPATLGSAEIVSDFDSYELRRVGLLPLRGDGIDHESHEAMETALITELDATTEFELLRLTAADLDEIPQSEPHRTGTYNPATILALARRYRLDAIIIGTVTDQQLFTPMRLGLQLDLVAAETGLAVWTAAVQLDTTRADVKQSLDAWSISHLGESETATHVSLISPGRFSRFAAWQIAQLL